MTVGKLSRAIASFLLLTAGSPVEAYWQGLCPNRLSTVTVEHVVEEYPICVSQYFHVNTAIIISGGVTIDVTNAPTFISTEATATVTTTVTVSGPTTATASPTTGVFAIQVLALGPAAGLKARQEPVDCIDGSEIGFVGPYGFLVTDIADAEQWFLSSGSLISVRSNRPVSVDVGLGEIPFAAYANAGPVTQTFEINGNGVSWRNDLFNGGFARFYYREAARALFIGFDDIIQNDVAEVFPYTVDPFNFQGASVCSSTTSSSLTTSSTETVSDISSTSSSRNSTAFSSEFSIANTTSLISTNTSTSSLTE